METGFWTQVSRSLSKSDCEERIWDHVAIERIGQRSPSGRGGRCVETIVREKMIWESFLKEFLQWEKHMCICCCIGKD